MKKTIVAMMIMAMTTASVAGCGSSSNDTAAAENTTDAAADTTAESTAEAVSYTHLDVYKRQDPANRDKNIMLQSGKLFSGCPGGKLTLSENPP